MKNHLADEPVPDEPGHLVAQPLELLERDQIGGGDLQARQQFDVGLGAVTVGLLDDDVGNPAKGIRHVLTTWSV